MPNLVEKFRWQHTIFFPYKRISLSRNVYKHTVWISELPSTLWWSKCLTEAYA